MTRILSFFPFINSIKNYNLGKLKKDIISAATVAIVALPQSMAYAIIAGVHPKYGLYAAIIPTMISSLFGSSRYLIAGPTNAISMVVSSTMVSVMAALTIAGGMPEDQKIALIFLLAFLVGVVQLLMGFFRLGNLINFVSHSVIIGFTAGAGILIAFNQIKNLIGVSIGSHVHFYEKMYHTALHVGETNIYSLALGLFTIGFILITKKFFPKLPGALLGMVLSAVFVAIFDLGAKDVALVGEIPQTLPPISNFPFNAEMVKALISPAIAIAILGIVEALAIAKSIASSSGEKIDGNQELIGQGLSNVSSAFFSSIPGSGSFTRSAVNFKSGAAGRFSGVFSGVMIMITVLLLAPLAKFIPKPSLAGILMVIAYSMIDKKAFAMSFKATITDRAVLIATMASTLILHLEMAIYVGVILSIALFLRKVSMPNVKKLTPERVKGKLVKSTDEKECPQLSIYQIEGSLFFGAVDALEKQLHGADFESDKVIIVRMKQVRTIDATGVHSLEKLLKELREKNKNIIFVGVNEDVRTAFEKSGALKEIGEENIVDNTEEAIKFASKRYLSREECKKCGKHVFAECEQE